MAKTDLVYSYSYKSSMNAVRLPGGIVLAIGLFIFVEALYTLFTDHTELGWFIFAEHFLASGALLAIIGFIFVVNRNRSVTITPKNIVCLEQGKSLSISMSQLVIQWPKRGQKTNRTLVLSDGQAQFQVDERFFPEFKDLLTKLKAFDTQKQATKREITLDDH